MLVLNESYLTGVTSEATEFPQECSIGRLLVDSKISSWNKVLSSCFKNDRLDSRVMVCHARKKSHRCSLSKIEQGIRKERVSR